MSVEIFGHCLQKNTNSNYKTRMEHYISGAWVIWQAFGSINLPNRSLHIFQFLLSETYIRESFQCKSIFTFTMSWYCLAIVSKWGSTPWYSCRRETLWHFERIRSVIPRSACTRGMSYDKGKNKSINYYSEFCSYDTKVGLKERKEYKLG